MSRVLGFMGFGDAFKKARYDGFRIRRKRWVDCKGSVRVANISLVGRPYMLYEELGEGEDYINRFIYAPSNEDLFAEDWEIYR